MAKSTGGKGGSGWAADINSSKSTAKSRRTQYNKLSPEFWADENGDLPF